MRKAIVITGITWQEIDPSLQEFRLMKREINMGLPVRHMNPIDPVLFRDEYEVIELEEFWWKDHFNGFKDPDLNLIRIGVAREVRELLKLPLGLLSWDLVEANKRVDELLAKSKLSTQDLITSQRGLEWWRNEAKYNERCAKNALAGLIKYQKATWWQRLMYVFTKKID